MASVHLASSSSSQAPINQTTVNSTNMTFTFNTPIKLDQSNYLIWRSQVLASIRGNRLEKFIDNSTTPPPSHIAQRIEDDLRSVENPEFATRRSQDQVLLGWLPSSMSEGIISLVFNLETSREVWKAIEVQFGSQSKFRLLHLRYMMNSTRKDDLKITDYFIKMKSIADNMAAAGSALSDDDLILHVLSSLGPDYNSVATYITGQVGVGKMNVNEAYTMLLTQEARIEQQTHMLANTDVIQNFEANLAYNKGYKMGNMSGGRGFGSFGYNSGYGNSGNSNSNGYKGGYGGSGFNANSGNAYGSNNQFKAYQGDNQRGGGGGHTANICWKLEEFMAFGAYRPPPNRNPKSAYLANMEGPADTNWYLDSGATHHLTNDINMHVSEAFTGISKLVVGNGAGLDITLIGSAALKSHNSNNASLTFKLNDILLVPQITKNLISISKLTKDNDVVIEFTNNFCFVKDNVRNLIILQGKAENGLYKLLLFQKHYLIPNGKQQCRLNTLMPMCPSYKLVGCKWVFRTKYNTDGSVSKHKARLVAKGFHQTAGINYSETFSPVVKSSTVRLILSLAVMNCWKPEGFVSKEGYICKLTKALYGLKQAPRAWYDKLKGCLTAWNFINSKADTSLFVKHDDKGIIIILVYVDDILVTGPDSALLEEFITKLSKAFALKDLGLIAYFLGVEVCYTTHGMHLSQTKYIKDLISKASMQNCKGSDTPFSTGFKLEKNVQGPLGQEFEEPALYRSIVGGLQYLILTRSDIAYSVHKLSQYLNTPTLQHWLACKKACDVDDRKSIGAYCIYLGNNLISWSSKKQAIVAKSSTESEYRALSSASSELSWLQSLLSELNIVQLPTPILWCDNQSAGELARNPILHSKSKHIELEIHYIRDKVLGKELEIRYIPTEEQVADVLTKALSFPKFNYFRSKLNVINRPLSLRGDVKEAHIYKIISKAEDHSNNHMQLRVDDMACQLEPGGYVQIWASNKIHREERSSMRKWDVRSLITSSSDLYGPEKDLVWVQLISGRTTAFADEPSEQDDSGLRAPLVATGLSLSNRIKLYYYCDPYELGKWASLSGV
ncbi:retrovirus-related pol polyprotein from transposon RE2 [Citrus sinensis]|uniref:Retrovirus-related pol polyprotein from transposon RE2 n=1 Tax=Citrus sinensis TaxID=2711 RepID=A0ACB8MBF9_CITSI|nr:retrovirus-related pol polyprotein from transposon RE2 [Citrus sinensis]